MSTIQRSVKRGNVRTFDASYKMGFKSAWASEVDADLDILYNAWNLGLDGSLAIADNTITTAKLMDGSVTLQKMAVGSVRGGGAPAGGNIVFKSVDGRVDILDGSITAANLAPGVITPPALGPGSVTTPAIADLAVTTAKLADKSVTTIKIADAAVTTLQIADGAVTDVKIQSLSWGKITGVPTGLPPTGTAGGSLRGTYPNPTLAPNSVGPVEIVDGSVAIAECAPDVIARFVPAYGPGYDNKVLTVSPGGNALQWLDSPPASLSPGQVSTLFIADDPNGVTDAKITSVSWSKVTGAPTSFPPTGTAGGDLAGTYPNPTIKPGTSLPPSGSAGGSLKGTYPNPGIAVSAVTATELSPTGVSGSTYGDAANYPVLGVHADGRVYTASILPLPILPTTLPPTGAAGGDLAGTYPNPTIPIATKSKWQVVGTALMPLDNTKAIALLPFGTAKFRLQAHNTVSGGGIFENRDWVNGNAQDDATKPSWGALLRSDIDHFDVQRQPAGSSSPANMLTIDGGGNMTLPVPGPYLYLSNGPILASVSFAAQRYFNLDVNAPWAPQVAGTPSWQLTLDPVSDFVGLWRRAPNAAAGTVTQPFKVDAVGNAYPLGYCIPRSRGSIVQVALNQVITTGGSDQTMQFYTGVVDTAGMINGPWHQIISPDSSQLILLTANVTQGGSNGRLGIQQWNGTVWVTRASSTTPVSAQVAALTSVSVICDTRNGTQFQATFANSGGSNVTLTSPNYFCAVLLGKTP